MRQEKKPLNGVNARLRAFYIYTEDKYIITRVGLSSKARQLKKSLYKFNIFIVLLI